MRIRHLLIVGLVLSTSLVTARLVTLELYARKAQQQEQLQLQVSLIARDAASLLVLGQDYLLHRNARASRQWRTVHAELSRTLPSVLQDSATYGDDFLDNAKTVREITDGLPALFEAIEGASATPNRADAQDRLDLLADQLVAETRRISEASYELTEQLLEVRKVQDRTQRIAAQVTVITLLVFIVGVGLVVWLRVLRPMASLESTAQAVKSGNLAARSGYRANDEFGSLSRAFDSMTGSLATAQHDLQNILDAVPSMIGYWDQNLINRFANRAYQLWFGVETEKLPGLHVRELLGEVLYARNLPFMEAVLRGEPQTFERTYRRPDHTGSRHSITHYVPDVVEGQVVGFYVVVHDVSDLHESRQHLAAVLRENEALLKAIHLYALVSTTDPAGRIVDVNNNFCSISGYSREELLGQTHQINNSGVHTAAFWESMWRAISSGATWRGEICNCTKDGQLYWVDTSITPLMGQTGEVERYISIQTDITAAKQLELKLRFSEGLLVHASKLADVGGWELDSRTQTLTWSAQTCQIHRVPSNYVPQLDTALDFYPGQARQVVESAVAHCIESGIGWDVVVPLITATGEAIWVRTVGETQRENGTVVKLIGAIQDITERKRAELRLLETSSLLRTVLDSASEVSIIATDLELRIKVFNAGAERLLGYTSAEVVGYEKLTFVHDQQELQSGAHALWDPANLGVAREWTYLRKDASRVSVSLVISAMYSEAGELLGYLGVAHDITHQKQYEQSLQTAMQKAEQANQAKSQFLANMSHEIRTPMNAVIGLSYLMGRGVLDVEQSALLAKINLASKSLLSVINDVLDLSKIEAGELMLEDAAFQPRELLQDLASVMANSAHAKLLAFTLTVDPTVPLDVQGDAARLS